MTIPNPTAVAAHKVRPGRTHQDFIECVVCGRRGPGIFVRIATGVCSPCEHVTQGRGCGQ